MPCLKILTNLPKNKVPSDFVDKIIPTLAKAVQKPAEKFICAVSSDCSISMFGDKKAPGAVATLESIGHVGPEENRVITKEISAFVEKELGIAPNRFFLTIYDLEAYSVGVAGTTVAILEK